MLSGLLVSVGVHPLLRELRGKPAGAAVGNGAPARLEENIAMESKARRSGSCFATSRIFSPAESTRRSTRRSRRARG